MDNLLIIQARTGSKRFPDKVLKELCGKTMLQHIVERVLWCEKIDSIIVATSIKEKDELIEKICLKMNIGCYRGSENDVLDRYYQSAREYEPHNIVRITADCPLADPALIDEIVDIHVKGNYDYTSNTIVETYPDGLDVEVFKFPVLEEAWRKADLLSEREHVTPYIRFKGGFKRFSVERFPSLADKRWTVDTEQDFEFITQIYNALYNEGRIFMMNDTLQYLDKNQHIGKMNAGMARNEGYFNSIANDCVYKDKN